MYRKYLKKLDDWLVDPHRKPLIVWGARQVGKSYLIKDLFAETKFKDKFIYVDCRIDSDFVNYCEKHINPKDVINYLSLDRNKVIDKNTLLIFDEAQECLPIITLLKYFCQDYPEIPIIVTGSMVRIKIQRTNRKRGVSNDNKFLFPVGKINQITVYPLNFEEFLMNSNQMLYHSILDAYKNKKALDRTTHEMALKVFYDYLLVGGMPEAVDIFLETNNYQKSRVILKDLYDNYLSDMELYQASPEAIVRAKKIFENIYSQLNKESKNFKSSLIEAKSGIREMRSPIDWLTLAYIVQKSCLLKEKVTVPLIDSNESLFRLYLADIGMFSYQSGINAATFIDKDARNALSGIFFENYVANELTNAGIKLFYWKGKNNSEFEFVVEFNSIIIPIDVKKSKGSLNSLNDFRNHNKTDIAVKISSNQYGYDEKNKILTIPFYEVFMLCQDLTSENVDSLI